MDNAKNAEQKPVPETNGAAAPAGNAVGDQAAVAPDPVAALEAEKNEVRDRLLRTLAEMENLRRRTEKEVADARSYGITGFARDMLGVADNLRRAMESVPKEIVAAADVPVKALLDGIELTERDLLKILERNGVKKIDPVGQKFDPNLHQAMFEAPNASVPKGTVLQVVQTGYVIADRVLRPALVGVSTGGPRVVEVEAASQDTLDRKV